MTQRSPSIPPVSGIEQKLADILNPIRENIEILKGRRGSIPVKLGPDATDQDRNNKINELIDWITQ